MRVVNHKNLITLHEVYETKNSLYVILELLEGGNLYEEMKSKQFMQGKEI